MSNVRQQEVRIVVEPLNHAALSVANLIYAIQKAAYTQEAELIATVDFPPLSRTLEDLWSSPERFYGAYVKGELVGAAAIEAGDRASIRISSLVVTPMSQRQGVGRALLHHIIKHHGDQNLQVQTAARNVPALALYGASGFSETLRLFVGTESLELITLSRSSLQAQNVA